MNRYARELGYLLTNVEFEQGLKLMIEAAETDFSCFECLGLAEFCHFGFWRGTLKEFALKSIQQAIENVTVEMLQDVHQNVWYRLARNFLKISLLYGTEEQIKEFCGRFSLDLDPGYTGRTDWEFPLVFLLFCNELRADKQPSDELEETISKCRKKRPVLALNAFHAATRGTQSEFEKAMVAGLTFFRKLTPSYETTQCGELTSSEYTIINALGNRNGKTTPELPVSLACALLTRDSIDNPVS